jgi:hypothetical protein
VHTCTTFFFFLKKKKKKKKKKKYNLFVKLHKYMCKRPTNHKTISNNIKPHKHQQMESFTKAKAFYKMRFLPDRRAKKGSTIATREIAKGWREDERGKERMKKKKRKERVLIYFRWLFSDFFFFIPAKK